MFVNGSLVGTTQTGSNVATIQNTTTDFFVGRVNTDGYYFDGLMDEISIFNEDLATSTITTLYNSGTPLEYSAPPTSTSTATSTATSTTNMSDTNFMLSVIIFFLTFIFLGLMFSMIKRK